MPARAIEHRHHDSVKLPASNEVARSSGTNYRQQCRRDEKHQLGFICGESAFLVRVLAFLDIEREDVCRSVPMFAPTPEARSEFRTFSSWAADAHQMRICMLRLQRYTLHIACGIVRRSCVLSTPSCCLSSLTFNGLGACARRRNRESLFVRH
jgi:hypothetical protein